LRDAFAAAFFFAFGLSIDPGDTLDVAGPVAIAVLLSVVLNVAAGVTAAKLQGFGRNAAANIGLTILGRGEFSLILATLATAAGLDERIGPFVALYVLVLAVLGPLLAARSRLFARLLPARLFLAVPEPQPIAIPGSAPDG
jgi:CPA2 family monovalent cation:H+ antiporter-2